MNHSLGYGTSSGDLNTGGNLSESSFLEALFGLEFGHADFANDADFLLCCLLVPQISRIYTDGWLRSGLPQNSQNSQKFLSEKSLPQISQMHTDFSSALPFYLFPTDFTDAHRFLFFVDEKDFVRNLFCFSLV